MLAVLVRPTIESFVGSPRAKKCWRPDLTSTPIALLIVMATTTSIVKRWNRSWGLYSISGPWWAFGTLESLAVNFRQYSNTADLSADSVTRFAFIKSHKI